MVELLDSVCDTLAPGAGEAGVAHFIDDQLAKPHRDCLLIVRYLSVKVPFKEFYMSALGAIDHVARKEFGAPFQQLSDERKAAFVTKLRDGNFQSWRGPPSQRVYFVLRSDAVDVVYGTEEGFENLGVPYMPHIWPDARW
ncbi:gluconate 2-dehydrogenase subunit 3 family protein [Hyphococcus sp.]|uniref:gluconate 2-dehydrogenase subunit 3 family protein n=1 Tax=Hyphococcus sp. TaxID=2038636 RepID=UPI003CCB7C72